MLTNEIGRGEVDPLRTAELGRCSDETDMGWKALCEPLPEPDNNNNY